MDTATGFTVAVTFIWLGMILAISFVEAPLKFRAPGVTVPIGLAIGRLVFRALNAIEVALALCVVGGLAMGQHRTVAVLTAAALTLAALLLQLAVLRPHLKKRTARVLAGEKAPPLAVPPWLCRGRRAESPRAADLRDPPACVSAPATAETHAGSFTRIRSVKMPCYECADAHRPGVGPSAG